MNTSDSLKIQTASPYKVDLEATHVTKEMMTNQQPTRGRLRSCEVCKGTTSPLSREGDGCQSDHRVIGLDKDHRTG